MKSKQRRSNHALWRACRVSIVGALILWGTDKYASGTVGYYGPELSPWEAVFAVEIALFGFSAAQLLLRGLFLEKWRSPALHYLAPLVLSVAFVGYSVFWLILLLLVALRVEVAVA